MKIKTLIILVLVSLLSFTPIDMSAKKKKKKYEKREIRIDSVANVTPNPEPVVITNPASQLYGEWNIVTLKKKKVSTQERAYIYLDFINGNKVYGNNGCNTINGSFKLNGNQIKFGPFIATQGPCHSSTSERSVMKAFDEVASFRVSRLYNMDHMDLLNSKGNVVMSLRRQNLDFLNGAWVVKELNSSNILEKNIRLVIDATMQTIHANSGCNIINGIITIDTSKEFAVQFEDLKSSNNQCPDIYMETLLLIALEQTESCKRINDHEMALLDNKGNMVIVISRLLLR